MANKRSTLTNRKKTAGCRSDGSPRPRITWCCRHRSRERRAVKKKNPFDALRFVCVCSLFFFLAARKDRRCRGTHRLPPWQQDHACAKICHDKETGFFHVSSHDLDVKKMCCRGLKYEIFRKWHALFRLHFSKSFHVRLFLSTVFLWGSMRTMSCLRKKEYLFTKGGAIARNAPTTRNAMFERAIKKEMRLEGRWQKTNR